MAAVQAARRGELLLLCTLSLWILLTAMPALQGHLPSLTLSKNSEQLSIPLAQALNQVVGLLNTLSAYSLLHQRAAGYLSLKSNLLFLTVAFLINTGHGMHTVCVLVEGRVQNLASVFALVDLMHEVVSHNMFVSGFYFLMILVMSTERNGLAYKLEKKLDGQNGEVNSNITSNGVKLSRNGLRVGSHGPLPANSNETQSQGIIGFLLHWAWPVVIGLYFSIFSTRTGTAPITVLFYLAVYVYTAITASSLLSKHLSAGEIFTLFNSKDLTVFGTIFKSSCIGLPVLVLWYANIIQFGM